MECSAKNSLHSVLYTCQRSYKQSYLRAELQQKCCRPKQTALQVARKVGGLTAP